MSNPLHPCHLYSNIRKLCAYCEMGTSTISYLGGPIRGGSPGPGQGVGQGWVYATPWSWLTYNEAVSQVVTWIGAHLADSVEVVSRWNR